MKIKYILALLIIGMLMNMSVADAAIITFNHTSAPKTINKGGVFKLKFWAKNIPFTTYGDARCWVRTGGLGPQVTSACKGDEGDYSGATIKIVNVSADCQDAAFHGCFMDSLYIPGGYSYKLNMSVEPTVSTLPNSFTFWMQACPQASGNITNIDTDEDSMGGAVNCNKDLDKWVFVRQSMIRIRGNIKLKARGLLSFLRIRG